MPLPKNTEFIGIHEAARLLGVSPRTLRRWDEKGILTPRRSLGNHRRYLRLDVERLLKTQELSKALDLTKESEFIGTDEAARLLGVSSRTLRRWDEKGILSPRRSLGNHRRYLRLDVQELI